MLMVANFLSTKCIVLDKNKQWDISSIGGKYADDQAVIAEFFRKVAFINSKGMLRDRKWDRTALYLSPHFSKQL